MTRLIGLCHREPVPGGLFGHFRVVRVGWRYHVVQYFYSDNMIRYCGLPGTWTAVASMRIAQALHMARQTGYDDGKADGRKGWGIRE